MAERQRSRQYAQVAAASAIAFKPKNMVTELTLDLAFLIERIIEKKLKMEEQQVQNGTEENYTVKFKKFFVKHIPIIQVISIKYFTSINCLYDIIAGISVGITLIPLSTAYAGLAGVPVETGLRTTLLGFTIHAIFGTVKEIFVGPSTFLSIIINDFTNGLNKDFVILLTFFTGLIQFVIVVTGLGYIVNFISLPVAIGFINGASFNIIVSMTPALIGLQTRGHGFIDKLLKLIRFISYTRYWSDAPLGFTCIVTLFILSKLNNIRIKYACVEKTIKLISVSRNAIVILFATAATGLMDKLTEQPFIVVGTIEGGLHIPSLPPFHTSIGNTTYNFKDMVFTLQGSIIVVPLISALATITIAKSYSQGKPIDVSQEFLSLSLANTFGGFLGAMPATGVIIGGAVASTCNVKTTFAGVYAGILSVLTLTFLTPYMYFIPKASLSAVIIFSVVVKLNIKIAYPIWKTDKSGFIIMIITMFLTLFRTLSEGLIGGILLSMIQLICTWSRPQISVEEQKVPESEKTYIEIKPDRGMYFPASETLRDIAIKHQDKKHPIVVNCNYFTEIDYTSLQVIKSLSNDLRLNGQELILMTGNPKFKEKINFATNVTVCLDENELNNHIH